ncbi:MAG: hypothetical protein NTY38_20945 [Acidobacteria bacterium]|nr:hypothetical protein [Acidobacteriota bacterium]
MFTWICPKCGTEVPPSYDDCPNCSGKLKAPPPVPGAPPERMVEPPPFARGVAAPPTAAPSHYTGQAHHAKSGLPAWLVTVLVAGGLIAVVGGGLYVYGQKKARTASAAVETPLPGRSESSPTKAHPYAKFLELSGLRITEEKEKAKVSVVVVNHSGAELPPLEIQVNLKAVTAKAESEPVATFRFQLPSMAPYSSKDLTVEMKTKMRAYELPDWQFLKAEFEIMTPVS